MLYEALNQSTEHEQNKSHKFVNKRGKKSYVGRTMTFPNYQCKRKLQKTETNPQSTPDSNDLTTKIIGDFGKWQLKISILMALLKLPCAWFQLNIVFLALQQDFWCVQPDTLKFSQEEWRNICSPRIEEHPCLIYDPDLLGALPQMDKSIIPLVPCKEFVYDTNVFRRTIISDWDLVCSKHWYIHMTQCVMMWGVLLGSIIFGTLADKYGRKMSLMVAIIMQAVFFFLASVMPKFWWFLLAWFIGALAGGGISIISFVFCLESVSGKYRTIVPILSQLPFFFGNVIMAGLAYWLRDWRKLDITLSALSALYIIYWCMIPESPRWLLATGQTEKAIEILKNVAAYNNMKFNEDEVKGMLLTKAEGQKRKDPGFLDFFRSKNMRLKTAVLSSIWFFSGLSFFTFSQYLGNIGGNIFVTIGLTGLIATLGGFLCVLIIAKLGRKKTVAMFQLITALCFVMLLTIPTNMNASDWPALLCAGIGFAGMAGSIPAMYLYSGELFPTLGRNTGVSGVTTFTRIASMIAPFVVSLKGIAIELPLIMLAIISFAQVFLLMLLPETKDRPLPDTMEDAEKF